MIRLDTAKDLGKISKISSEISLKLIVHLQHWYSDLKILSLDSDEATQHAVDACQNGSLQKLNVNEPKMDGGSVKLRDPNGPMKWSCEKCHRGFKRKDQLTRHSKTHMNERNKLICMCGESFVIKKHWRRKHGSSI